MVARVPLSLTRIGFVGKGPRFRRDKGWWSGGVGALCLSSCQARRRAQDRHKVPTIPPFRFPQKPTLSRLKNKEKEKRGRNCVNFRKEDLLWRLNFSLSAPISKLPELKKVGCKMQQICSKSPLTKPLERDPYQSLKKRIANATDLQQISIGIYPCKPL
jgi:hypothetical protein